MLAMHKLDQVICANLEKPDLERVAAADEPQNAAADAPNNIPIPTTRMALSPYKACRVHSGNLSRFRWREGTFPRLGKF
jgi:hypothetical protein